METKDNSLESLKATFTEFSASLRLQLQNINSKKRKREEDDDTSSIEEIRKQLEDKLAVIEQKLQDLDPVNKGDDEEVIKLNVGGELFVLSKENIMKYPNSMLGTLFSGRYHPKKDENGCYFIDRDPTHFKYIANFYRHGSSLVLPSSYEEQTEIANEADFFQLDAMHALIKGPEARQNALVVALGAVNHRMREEENTVRRLFLTDPGNDQLKDRYVHLIDVYKEIESFKFVENEEVTMPLMFDKNRIIGTGCSITPSLDQFKLNFEILTFGMFKNFDWNNVLVAGGAVLAALMPLPNRFVHHDKHQLSLYYHGTTSNFFEAVREKTYVWPDNTGFQHSDIDLFLYGMSEEEALAKIQQIFESIKESKLQYEIVEDKDEDDGFAFYQQRDKKKILVVRTARTLTVVCGWPRRHVQIVLRLYKSPAEVLLGFDIDCVGVGFDGSKVVCLPRTRRALNYRFNIADPSRQTYRTNTYEYRLWKYSQRGFAVAIPGLVRKIINPEVYTKKYSELKGFSKLLFFEVRENQTDIKILLKYRGQWMEKHGFPISRENFNRVDGLNTLNQDVVSLLNDYNDGLFLTYAPGRLASEFEYELKRKINQCIISYRVRNNDNTATKPLCFIMGNSIDSILDAERWNPPIGSYKKERDFVVNVPRHIHFIGSLAEYIQSLPEVEEDWFKDVF